MSAITEQFKNKLSAALAGEKARTALNDILKNKVVSEADLTECFRLYLTSITPERRVKFDSDTQQRDLAIGYVLWLRTIELATEMNGFADLAPFIASMERDEPASERRNLNPPRALTDLQSLYLHWRDLAFSNPIDTRPEILARSKKKKMAARGMISPLIDAYRAKNQKWPTLEELLEFNPTDDRLKKEFDQKVAVCDRLWRQFETKRSKNTNPVKPSDASLSEFDAAFASFRTFLSERATDPLVFFQVLKWIRELEKDEVKVVRSNRAESQTKLGSAPYWQELYLEAASRALQFAANKWKVLAVQKARKLTGEDRRFFLAPVPPDGQLKLELRLEWSWMDSNGFVDFNTNRRRLGRFAAYSSIKLLDEFETVALQNHIASLIAKNGEKAAQRFVKVGSTYVVFRDTYRTGQDILDSFTIVWIEESGGMTSIIVEFHNMNYALFRTDMNGLQMLVEDAFWRKMKEIAQQVQRAMLAYLEVVGLVGDVLAAVATAGATAGFRRIAIAFIKDKLEDKVTDEVLDAFHIENPAARSVAGIAISKGRGMVGNKASKVIGLDRDTKYRSTEIDLPPQRLAARGTPVEAAGIRAMPAPQRSLPRVDSAPANQNIPQSGASRVANDNIPAPPGPRRRYAVVENGRPKLVTEAERNIIERNRPKAKPFMEDAVARYVVPVKFSPTGAASWFPEVLVGAGSKEAYRTDLTRYLNMLPQGPLSRALLVNGQLAPGNVRGQGAAYWAQHAELGQAAHVLSDNAGGPQILIFMSAHHNQRFKNNLEGRPIGIDKPGQLLIEDAFVIQGVAVHRGTAHDLVDQGKLDAAVLRDAEIIRFVY